MTCKKRVLSVLIIFSLLLTACNFSSIPTNANTAFQNFTLSLFQQEVTSSTINLHYTLCEPQRYGITEIPISFGTFDLNQASASAYVENLTAALGKFSYSTLSPKNQLTYDILSYYFAQLKNDISYYLYDEPLSPVTGIHAQLPILLAEYRFYDTDDIKTYLALLTTLPDYFSSLVRFEQQKSAVGLFMSDPLADEVIEQCNAFVSMDADNYLFSTFQERLNELGTLSAQEQNAFVESNQKIIYDSVFPAYRALASALSTLKGTGKNTNGLCNLPNGKAYYTHLVAGNTGSTRSMSELKEMIYRQIKNDLIDCQNTLSKTSTTSSQTNVSSPDKILKTLKEKIATSFPAPPSVSAQIKYVPKSMEEYLSPAFYLTPAIDAFGENTIYINHSYSMDDITLFTTMAHEGYPGHLYQATYFANTNYDPVRTCINFPGYIEGWATYAEMCSYYISPLNKPEATFLQKSSSAILGLYAAADIGIHYDGWTLDEMTSFFSSYGFTDESAMKEIYQYILGDPANYLSYYVGYLEILELKKKTNLSQKAFHQKLLEIGPAPFNVIATHWQ